MMDYLQEAVETLRQSREQFEMGNIQDAVYLLGVSKQCAQLHTLLSGDE